MIFLNFARVLLALLSFAISVSATHCEADYKHIYTVTTCTTKFGSYKVYHVPTSFKTVTSKTSTTVTITPPAVTYTVTAPDITVTDDVTTTITVTKDSYKCPTKTKFVYTWVTVTHTFTKVKTETTSVTTTVVAQTTHYGGGGDHGHYKRHNAPPYPAPSFPTAVKCTKTVEITFTCSTTAYAPTVTVTQPGKYVTVTYTDTITKTVCPKKTKTITITHTKVTETKVKTTTTKTKTFTVTIHPTPSPVNRCDSHNQYRGPHGNVYADTFKWDPQFPANSAKECCELCFKHVNYAGVHDCAGSFFVYDRKHYKGKCFLKLTDKCYSNYKEPCKGAPKNYGYDGTVSNGPCGKWEYHD